LTFQDIFNRIKRLFSLKNTLFCSTKLPFKGFYMTTKYIIALLLLIVSISVQAASTSWTGTVSTSWSTSGNWTNGVPTATLDVIIGDASFTGTFQPTLSASKNTCLSLTIGNAAKVSTLSLSNNNKNLTVLGNITIGANGSILQSAKSTLKLTGNWVKNGTYTASNNNATVTFAGTTQTITGTSTFQKLTISAGSITTANSALTVNNVFSVSGTFDPGTNLMTLAGSFSVLSGGYIKVQNATFAGNYSANPSLNATSSVNYSSTLINQTVSALSYGTLILSGGTVKTAAGSFSLLSSNSGVGNIQVTTGSTFDIAAFTVKRGSTGGGALTLANSCTLKVAGAFPINFSSYSLGPTSITNYYGGSQTVYATTYGYLNLSTASGPATKTFPASAVTVISDLTTSTTSGTLTATAGAALTVNGNVNIGSSTTFSGLTYAHTFGGNFTNAGTVTASTGSFTFTGANALISGAGTYTINDLILTRSGITADAATNMTLSGNLSTVSPGTFQHVTGGTGIITMNGTSKTISGLSIGFNNLVIAGSITTTNDFSVASNFTVNASSTFTATGGNISLTGSSKVITNNGTLTFYSLNISSSASITTATSCSITGNLSVNGTLTASAGTVTFNGTSILSGTANLFNATINGTKLTLNHNSVLGIAGAFVLTAGTFDVTSSVPNTVNYNSSGAQSVLATTYNNLTFSTGGTKTALGNITINQNITINSGVTFAGSTFTHTLYNNWYNYGSFTAGTCTVQFLGITDSYITGTTTFYNLTLNKSSSAYALLLNNNITVSTVNMTTGGMTTGSNSITITTTRTGSGIILGTITRTHSFSANTAYAFESAVNTVTFQSLSTVTSITTTVTIGTISDYPFVSSVSREYDYLISSSGAYSATLRLHYQDAELAGNNETVIALWRNSGTWASVGKTANDSSANWVEESGITNIAGRWTLAGGQNIVQWTGAVDTDWTKAGNWQTVQGSPSTPPGTSDIVLIGSVSHVNQPAIATNVTIGSMILYSVTPSTLTVTSGSLTVHGSVSGNWSAAAVHTINMGAQNLYVGGNLILSNGTSGNTINLNYSSATITVIESLIQSGGANITASGAGNLIVGNNYTYSSGTYTPATSTFTYNGSTAQTIAAVPYYNLTLAKSSGVATVSTATTVNGNLTTTTGGELDLQANMTVLGNVSIGTNTILDAEASSIQVGGNWTLTGTFVQGSGTVTFNGTIDQNISSTVFNNLIITKTSGIAYAAGAISTDGDVTLQTGTLDIVTYNLSRTSYGGTLTLGSGTTLKIGGASNAPFNYATQTLDPASTVTYNGTVAQSVPDLAYGNLVFSNGGTNAKSISTAINVSGDLTINSGATLSGNGNTISLSGNWVNNGTYNAASGTLRLLGTSKLLNGSNTFYNITCLGSYSTVAGTTTTILGLFTNSGTFTQQSDIVYFYGNLINTGTLTLYGVTNIMGQTTQTIANDGTLVANAASVVNYNGTVSTLSYSTSAPVFATVNINNTGGITVIQPWTVAVAMTVGAGASFNGGGLAHTILGNFTNNGTVTNNGGTFTFSPSTAVTINLGANFSSTGGVIFGGSGAITMAGSGVPSFGTVLISNTNAAGITPSSNWTATGEFTVQSGAIFHGGVSQTLNLWDQIAVNGSFDGGTSSVVLNGNGDISGVGNITFNNLIIDSVTAALNDFGITGNLTYNGTFDPTDYTITFSGTSASQVTGTSTPFYFNILEVAKTASSLTFLIDSYTYTLIQIDSGSTVHGTTTTLNLEGDWNNNGTFSELPPTSTVNFLGSSPQTVEGTSVTNFGNVIVNNTTGLTLASATVINGILTLTAGNVTSNGNLSQNLYYGAIAGTGTGTTTGNIRFFKTIWGDRYHYLSTPIGGLTAAQWNDNVTIMFGSNSNLYSYDETVVNTNQQVGWKALTTTSASLATMTGYALFFPEFTYNTMLDVSGPYTHGATFSSGTLTNTPSGLPAADGWNLMGNPYPSTIDWDAASGVTKTGINNAIYTWDGRTNRFVSYVSGIGTNGGTRYLGSMQGFFLKVTASGGTGSLALTNNARVTSTLVDVWRTSSVDKILRLSLSNSSYDDETVVRFTDSATTHFDTQLDAYKLINPTPTPSIYSYFNSDEYAINSLPTSLTQITIPLKLDAGVNGSYTVNASLTGFAAADSMFFVDKLLGVRQDLKANPVYTCDLTAGDTTTRFFINYKNLPAVATETISSQASSTISIYGCEQKVMIHFTDSNINAADIVVYDMKGTVLYNKKNQIVSGGQAEVDLSSVSTGIYVVRVQSGQASKSQDVYLWDN
jgi:fibronectin-binding autotransporter adhesin